MCSGPLLRVITCVNLGESRTSLRLSLPIFKTETVVISALPNGSESKDLNMCNSPKRCVPEERHHCGLCQGAAWSLFIRVYSLCQGAVWNPAGEIFNALHHPTKACYFMYTSDSQLEGVLPPKWHWQCLETVLTVMVVGEGAEMLLVPRGQKPGCLYRSNSAQGSPSPQITGSKMSIVLRWRAPDVYICLHPAP